MALPSVSKSDGDAADRQIGEITRWTGFIGSWLDRGQPDDPRLDQAEIADRIGVFVADDAQHREELSRVLARGRAAQDDQVPGAVNVSWPPYGASPSVSSI
jgi:hypothetical protein